MSVVDRYGGDESSRDLAPYYGNLLLSRSVLLIDID